MKLPRAPWGSGELHGAPRTSMDPPPWRLQGLQWTSMDLRGSSLEGPWSSMDPQPCRWWWDGPSTMVEMVKMVEMVDMVERPKASNHFNHFNHCRGHGTAPTADVDVHGAQWSLHIGSTEVHGAPWSSMGLWGDLLSFMGPPWILHGAPGRQLVLGQALDNG